MNMEMVEVAASAPLFIFDFGNQQNREKLRQAQVDRAMVVSLRRGCCMHKPAVDGLALLRADGELAISVSVGTAKEVLTWAYADVLEAMDYLEANRRTNSDRIATFSSMQLRRQGTRREMDHAQPIPCAGLLGFDG